MTGRSLSIDLDTPLPCPDAAIGVGPLGLGGAKGMAPVLLKMGRLLRGCAYVGLGYCCWFGGGFEGCAVEVEGGFEIMGGWEVRGTCAGSAEA